MYADIVKVDVKGRITIPSALRLLLNIEEGDKLIILFDEDLQKIEIVSAKSSDLTLCTITSSLNKVLELLTAIGNNLIAMNCRCIDASCNRYRCKLIISKNWFKMEKPKDLQCL
ncbi:AbrB/MazE/SpoVT family DNA-binding domain-containing protein [Ignisphaera sp. 4213-co]|uniref:AbrB/MazE/SpoVT family DNA-binding domain-containing protein n=1 Tax=Ignisphaera cupida TaxID=3050454 RepID=A0ABD4Z487_9CREN|nr:AbrB/MazE/SpoVT family DNA-binding domain-containing protein [Ignisphaera sp. 4213-co]MDK6027965.1 AbrB/MazE/SpoVT family DNA-binding domain-containing protein [Ignisphaera sp. 4213-co]